MAKYRYQIVLVKNFGIETEHKLPYTDPSYPKALERLAMTLSRPVIGLVRVEVVQIDGNTFDKNIKRKVVFVQHCDYSGGIK